MSAVRALIAAPLPPTATWQLLRDVSELPDGYGIFGSVQIGRAAPRSVTQEIRARFVAQLKASAAGVSLEQWQELFALYCKLTRAQRAELNQFARGMLPTQTLPAPAMVAE